MGEGRTQGIALEKGESEGDNKKRQGDEREMEDRARGLSRKKEKIKESDDRESINSSRDFCICK